MNITFKAAAATLATVIGAHVLIASSAAMVIQNQANTAMIPVLHAEKIVVTAKPMEVFTADKIVVQATPKTTQLAVLSWNTVV